MKKSTGVLLLIAGLIIGGGGMMIYQKTVTLPAALEQAGTVIKADIEKDQLRDTDTMMGVVVHIEDGNITLAETENSPEQIIVTTGETLYFSLDDSNIPQRIQALFADIQVGATIVVWGMSPVVNETNTFYAKEIIIL